MSSDARSGPVPAGGGPSRRRRPAGLAPRFLLLFSAALAGQLGCTGAGPAGRPETSPPAREPEPAPAPAAEIGHLLDGVQVHPWSFDPSVGDSAEIAYTLAAPARVTVSIYGPNHELVARPAADQPRRAGRHREAWDGRDASGAVVPDEAYYPVIEAVSETGVHRHDPVASSGGERVNPRDIHFRPDEDLISYVLPEPCRVLVRAGLDPGPMLATPVNWKPRGPGLTTERWTGHDQQGVRSFSTDPDALVIVQAYALPDTSVITFGNRDVTYRERYLAWGVHRPTRPPPEREGGLDALVSPHWGQPVHLDKDPAITVTFPAEEDGPPADPGRAVRLEGDEVIVRVEVPDPEARRFLREQRFELVAFVDDERVDEAEQGHLPFNWSWDLSSLEPGEHWLTLNLVTFRQHVGSATRRVQVAAPAGSRPGESGAAGGESER